MSLCWTLLDNDDNCFCVIECRRYKTEWLMLVDWSKENTKLDRDPNNWMTETLLDPFVTGRTRSVRSRRDSKSTNRRERFDSPAHGKVKMAKQWSKKEQYNQRIWRNLKTEDRNIFVRSCFCLQVSLARLGWSAWGFPRLTTGGEAGHPLGLPGQCGHIAETTASPGRVEPFLWHRQ